MVSGSISDLYAYRNMLFLIISGRYNSRSIIAQPLRYWDGPTLEIIRGYRCYRLFPAPSAIPAAINAARARTRPTGHTYGEEPTVPGFHDDSSTRQLVPTSTRPSFGKRGRYVVVYVE